MHPVCAGVPSARPRNTGTSACFTLDFCCRGSRVGGLWPSPILGHPVQHLFWPRWDVPTLPPGGYFPEHREASSTWARAQLGASSIHTCGSSPGAVLSWALLPGVSRGPGQAQMPHPANLSFRFILCHALLPRPVGKNLETKAWQEPGTQGLRLPRTCLKQSLIATKMPLGSWHPAAPSSKPPWLQ